MHTSTTSMLSSTKIPLKDVRAIVAERVAVTRTQLCDEFHVIMKRMETLVDTFSHDVHLADTSGQTVSYGQLYATLNHFQAVLETGREQIEKLRTSRT